MRQTSLSSLVLTPECWDSKISHGRFSRFKPTTLYPGDTKLLRVERYWYHDIAAIGCKAMRQLWRWTSTCSLKNLYEKALLVPECWRLAVGCEAGVAPGKREARRAGGPHARTPPQETSQTHSLYPPPPPRAGPPRPSSLLSEPLSSGPSAAPLHTASRMPSETQTAP